MTEAKKIAVIVVHGMGNQSRYDYLKEASSAFVNGIRRLKLPSSRLAIDSVEMNRPYTRTSETSDLQTGNDSDPARSRTSLFRPVRVSVKSDGKVHEVSFYEVYWADTDLRYTWLEKLRFTAWLTSAMWNPIFNCCKGYYDKSLSCVRVLARIPVTLLAGLFYHLGDGIFLMLPFVSRFRNPSRRWNNVIHEYAGDVKLYVSDRRYFHNQEKRDVIRARFDEVLLKALIENHTVHVVGHSLGSAIAFDGLTRHRVQFSKMSKDFRDFLWDQTDSKRNKTVKVQLTQKLKTLVTLGSPLDKLYFFFPWRRSTDSVQTISSILGKELSGEKRFRTEHGSPSFREGSTESIYQQGLKSDGESRHCSSDGFEWHNFSDVIDPFGAKIDHFSDLNGIPAPTNHEFAWAVLPFRAHTGYWRNENFVDWILQRILTTQKEPCLTAPSLWSRTWRCALQCAYYGVFAVVMLILVIFLGSLVLGTLEDFHTNAESRTAYVLLHPLALALGFTREHLGLFPGTLQSLSWGLMKATVYFLIASFAYSAVAYYCREKRASRQ